MEMNKQEIDKYASAFDKRWHKKGQALEAVAFLTEVAAENPTWTDKDKESLLRALYVVQWNHFLNFERSYPLNAGKRIVGNYEFQKKLAPGGMGNVYLAKEKSLMKRTVAIKVVRDELAEVPATLERFKQELECVGNLYHQNIVHSHTAEQINGKLLLVMEYVDGENLQKYYKRRVDSGNKIQINEALTIVRQVAAGLRHAHKKKIVHRDIKPANIMFTDDGTAKILDFGLGKLLDQTTGATLHGEVLGTIDYLSPEQLDDSSAVDIQTDIYALGCTFYFLVVGEVPFPIPPEEKTLVRALAWRKKNIDQEVPTFAEVKITTTPVEENILRKMCANAKAQRFFEPEDVLKAIDEYQSANGQGSSEPTPETVTNLRFQESFDASLSQLGSLVDRFTQDYGKIDKPSKPEHGKTYEQLADILKGIGTFLFIDGVVPAFSALTAALGRAKEVIRTTRFSPYSVATQPEFKEMIRNRILGLEGHERIPEFHRIIAANAPMKWQDIEEYLNDCVGRSGFTLYLTAHPSAFELVLIDDKEVFIHFHGRDRIIDSTLHIFNEDKVVKKFVNIYRTLCDPAPPFQSVERHEFQSIRSSNVRDERQKMMNYFASHLGTDWEDYCKKNKVQ